MSDTELKTIDDQIAEFFRTTDVSRRRRAWPAARDIIVETLRGVIAKIPQTDQILRAYVDVSAAAKNFEVVQLRFGNNPTGIARSDGASFIAGSERGGVLVFGQGEIGRIVPVIYPFSTTLPGYERDESAPWVGESIEPEDITPEYVISIAIKFLRFAPTTSMFWEGDHAGLDGFSPPDSVSTRSVRDDIQRVLHDTKVTKEIILGTLPSVLNDLGRLTDELEDREIDMLVRQMRKEPRFAKLLKLAIKLVGGKVAGELVDAVIDPVEPP